MAHIKDRRDRGRGWVVRYRTPDQREHSRSFAKKRDADTFLKTVGADLVRGDYIDPAAGKTRLNVWSRRWLEVVRPTLKASTIADYESMLRSRVLPQFGSTPVVAVRASDVQEWVGKMTEEGLSASRIRKCVVVLKMMMDAAARDGMVRANPVVGVKQPRIERHEAAYFTPAVVDRIADAMPRTEYQLLIRVLGIGGLRFGEAAALDRECVDLLRRRLVVRASLSEISGRLVRSSTKTYAVRQVPIPAGLAAELGLHLDTIRPGVPVFRSPQLGELRYGAFYGRIWKPTLQDLGLPRTGIHVLRHSAAARLIQAGASPKAVQAILGHRSAAFTLTVYGHLFDADLDDLMARVESPVGPARDVPPRLPHAAGEESR